MTHQPAALTRLDAYSPTEARAWENAMLYGYTHPVLGEEVKPLRHAGVSGKGKLPPDLEASKRTGGRKELTAAVDEWQAQVVVILADADMTRAQIVEATGIEERLATNRLRRMKERGLIHVVGYDYQRSIWGLRRD